MSIAAVLAELESRLSGVYTALTGRPALETTSQELPVMTLVSMRDELTAEVGYDEMPTATRSAYIECKVSAASDSYQDDLNDALIAIRAAIAQDSDGRWLGGAALEIRQQIAAFNHPTPGGEIATVVIPIDIDYTQV